MPGSGTAPLSVADIELARVRARRRLVGMVVLVVAGVIGFPWLFETQPRPMNMDVQVSAQAHRGGAGAVVAPAPGPVAAKTMPRESMPEVAARAEAPLQAPVQAPSQAPIEERLEAREAPPEPKPLAKPASAGVADKADGKTDGKATARAEPAPPPKAQPDGARALALLDGKAAEAPATRFVVQIGAFTEASSAQEVRKKVERLGIKTYTQEVNTAAGKRIRVRVGPYNDRADAEKAAVSLTKAGVTTAVLTL